jgi:hypothetical protein
MTFYRYTCGCLTDGSDHFKTHCPNKKHNGTIVLTPVRGGGRPKVTDDTNKEQGEYGNYLGLLKLSGEILNYHRTSMKFLIGKQKNGRDAWYKPDFDVWRLWQFRDVQNPEMIIRVPHLEMHEYKGHWEQAAKVRIKAAALRYPEIPFIAAYKDGPGNFRYEEF